MVAPKIEIHIDFDEDGVFADDEEVSSDVKAFSITEGFDMFTRMPRSRFLTMTLNNRSHKYTPSNTASPLYPFQLPGPDCRVRFAYPYDGFAGDDGDALNGRDVPLASDQSLSDPNYTTWAANAHFEVRTNHIECTTAGSKLAVIDQPGTWNSKLKFGAIVQRESGTIVYPHKQSLFVYRYADDNNYSEVALERTSAILPLEVKFNKVVAGSLSAYSASDIENDIISIWADGAKARVEIQLYHQEIIVWVDDHVASLNDAQATGVTNTKFGIGGEEITANAVSGTAGSRLVQWDDFGGWSTKFMGRADLVRPQPDTGESVCVIQAYDDLERARLDLVQDSTAISSDMAAVAGKILSGIDIAATKRIIDDGTLSLNPTYRMPLSRNGYAELVQVANDWYGRFWVDGHGVYRIENKDHRGSTPHGNSAWSVRDTDVSGSVIGMVEPIGFELGLDRVENEIFYQYFRVTAATAATVWQLEVADNPIVDFSQTPVAVESTNFQQMDLGIIGEQSNAVGFLVPIPGTDYSIDGAANGTGIDWATSLVSESGTVSMASDYSSIDDTTQRFDSSTSLGGASWPRNEGYIIVVDSSNNRLLAKCVSTNPDGDGTRVNLTNGDEADSIDGFSIYRESGFSLANTPLTYDVFLNAAYVIPGYEGNFVIYRIMINDGINDIPENAYITSGQARAEQHTSSSQTASRSVDSASTTRYGRRPLSHPARHIDNLFHARIMSAARLADRKDEKWSLKYNVNGSYAYANLWHCIWSEMGDRIDMFYSDAGLTGKNFFLENQTLTVRDGGHVITSEFEGLET